VGAILDDYAAVNQIHFAGRLRPDCPMLAHIGTRRKNMLAVALRNRI
jgi:hypothetical protein